ncbi:MAG TPA: DNA methyltransferase, partial [Pirellulaceae bacterium]|nr:DNA methyltransferase [Pirellulaceae bacterium]
MAKRRASNTSKLAGGKSVETIVHEDASRKNIPTAEYQSVMETEAQYDTRVAYARRNRDLDPQLMWRGKDEQDLSDLVVNAPPIYIQEKVHPKVLIDDLIKQTTSHQPPPTERQLDLFADFNGLPDSDAKTEFYQHEANWTNRMILGDSLQVMASLAEREGLKGKVQCIYFDPPYGIKFNSNFQWSTTSRDVKDGNTGHITREPEQVKAFRDTWRDGIHSYLTYLRDRLTVARDLLTESGSIFVQIGDENVHRVRTVMDEVFGEQNCIAQISFAKTSGYATNFLTGICDYILWYGKSKDCSKFRQPFGEKNRGEAGASKYNRIRMPDGSVRQLNPSELMDSNELPAGSKMWVDDNCTSQGNPEFAFAHQGKTFSGTYKTTLHGMARLGRADRIYVAKGSHRFIRFLEDFQVTLRNAAWMDIGGVQSRTDPKVYVVQTANEAVKRCILMTSDPGDLVLDPTCGSGTTATVAEQWGRRWITIDTSRVALALARARIMGAKYPFYLLSDSYEGQAKETQLRGFPTEHQPQTTNHSHNIRHGFVYERVPHITLKSIANNTEIDVIWEKFQAQLEPLREQLNKSLKQKWEEWEIPREADDKWSKEVKTAHQKWWELRIKRQKEIDASIAAKAEFEYLYDKPYEDKKKVRVAGPFTVESLSPHRSLIVGADDELIDPVNRVDSGEWLVTSGERDFTQMILEQLKTAGVQQSNKEDKITFSSLVPWPGRYICAEGVFEVNSDEWLVDSNNSQKTTGHKSPATGPATSHQPLTTKRAAIFIGPEFGTVSKPDLAAAAREAGDAGFDVLIACAFNYDAHSTDFGRLGRVQVLKARMNADLHMADDLKNTGKGNLFVIFGEPDIDILTCPSSPADGRGDGGEGADMIQVKVNGVDVFHPNTGEVRSDGADGIACWFIDTDYNEESFFVRHAY